ncbi:MAG: hypothetical protein JRE64_03205 [Deltaproteobacteria bacterium]|nr:hypothetical protein [Deltaproteobacteria bacterium]
MNIDAIKNTLNLNYRDLEEIAPNIFCAMDRYHEKPYAVRYFDLSDKIASHSERLNEYLEKVLGKDYFETKRPIDLRWNNYLYFVTSDQYQQDEAFQRAKFIIESNREYARKFVISETDLPKYIGLLPLVKDRPKAPVKDLYSTWLKILNDKQLGYVLDFSLKPPEIVRKIGNGELGKLEQTTSVGKLTVAERDAITHPLQNLAKNGFRKYPKENEFEFGSRVNLITGPNGHGKTSLLEAIEYLYCGSTYRNGAPGEQTQVIGSLLNSSQILKINSNKLDVRRLKARNLGWYGKSDVRGSSLHESFARFNFMDTDAAIRVSVEGTSLQLSEDIARILLGAEAGKASDQIQRTHLELKKQLKVNEKDRCQSDEQIQLLQKEADNLKNMTKQSDTLFQQLNQLLKKIHWIDRPKNADDMSINVLSENLATANHQCKLIESSTLEDLKKQRQEFESYSSSLATLIETVTNTNSKINFLTSQKAEINRKLNLVEELQTYSGLDLLVLDQQKKEHTAIINGLQAKLPNLQRIDLMDNNLAALPLNRALSITDAELSKVSKKKADTVIKIEEHERSKSALGTLRDQLISAATQMLESLPDKNHCPLCHTQFEEGQLMLRIARDTVSDSGLRSVDLRNKLMTLQTSEEKLQQSKSLLMTMISYCGEDSNVTGTLALSMLKQDKQKVSEYQESLKRIISKLTDYREGGLEANRLKELMKYLEITKYTSNKLEALLQSLQTKSAKLTKEINNKKVELDEIDQQIKALAERSGQSKSLPGVDLIQAIAAKIKGCDQKIAAAMQLATFLDLKKDFSAIALSHQINEARDIVSKLITERKREEETNSRSQLLEHEIKINRANLTERQTTFKHLSRAIDILSDLLSGHNSLMRIKQELLKNNAAIISKIFSKIHQPNEFDINFAEEGIKLSHKVTRESRSLKEVSTGQRAAFALSLFLTMNKLLGNGPRVLLLDDPISHIDDINMLSFLDYLRELAIDGERQIFFTTPNAKLSSLFRHKFRFMGDNEFKEIHLTR